MAKFFVAAKIAQSIDGKTATADGESKWITSAAARKYARLRRDQFDAIMVGVNTVIKDNPRLTGARKKDLKRAVLDTRLRIPLNSKILSARAARDTIIFTTPLAPKKKLEAVSAKGAAVVVGRKSAQVDITAALKELKRVGCRSVLIEGGAHVIGSALKAGCVDQVHVYVAPKIFGDEKALGAVAGLTIKSVKSAINLRNMKIKKVSDHFLVTADVYRNR